MKYLALACCFFWASCNMSNHKKQTTVKDDTAPMGNSQTESAYKDIDPVCDMVRDSTWTDYTVYKGDTVWFCSDFDKRAFVANPQKYQKK